MFENSLELKVIGNQRYEVTRPLIYKLAHLRLVVHEGFDFDGASIPRALWSLIGSPLSGGYQRSACLHDALYASQLFPRAKCDEIFLEAMKSEGIGRVKRYLMYSAVRAFGASAYQTTKEEKKKYESLVSISHL